MLLSRFSLSDLPPRVVIHGILTFHTFKIDEESDSLCLFGFFKRDRARNIWNIFLSLKIKKSFWKMETSNYDSNIIFNFSKIVFIRLKSPSNEFMKRISIESTNMFNLERIVIDLSELNKPLSIRWNDLFARKSKGFIRLKSLTMKSKFKEILSEMSDWYKHNDCQFSNLTELDMTYCSWLDETKQQNDEFINPLYFGENSIIVHNITRLNLSYIRFNKRITSEFHNLEFLHINRCENLWVLPKSGKLRSFCVYGMCPEYFMKVYSLSPNLEEFKVFVARSDESFDYSTTLLQENTNKLEKLTKLQLFGIEINEKQSEFWRVRLIPQLRELMAVITDMTIIKGPPDNLQASDVITEFEYPNLTSLSLNLNRLLLQYKGSKWNCSKTIVRLELRIYVEDSIFIENSWPKLEVLTIRMYNFSSEKGNCTGEIWKPIPNLKKFEMSGINFFNDSFFQRMENIRNVEDLTIIFDAENGGEQKIEGKDWNDVFYQKIEKVKFEGVKGLKDEFFSRRRFDNLKTIRIKGLNEKVCGKGWKGNMKCLRKLRIEDCPNVKVTKKDLL